MNPLLFSFPPPPLPPVGVRLPAPRLPPLPSSPYGKRPVQPALLSSDHPPPFLFPQSKKDSKKERQKRLLHPSSPRQRTRFTQGA
ncbi:hypothetical protein IE53DRAFT_391331 [Violaceomyces palustris]|uniref:Uncharacterized protein n=1 Tax=Violaceomyces palustris TaxID=1673888 RepID=A0ACD0NKX7_9BASI|nr:hypothetical protein IE53DRAFT_391331 [Violaceomyces palustris]